MTHKEKYLRVEQERHDLVTSLAGLPDDLQRERDGLKPLEDEVTRREILGEAAGDEKRKLDAGRETVRRKTQELEEGRDRARVMLAVLSDLRSKAEADMMEPAKRRFFAGVKELLKKLEEVRQAEAALASLQQEIGREFDAIGSRCPIDRWQTLIIRNLGDPTFRAEISAFVEQMKAWGLNV